MADSAITVPLPFKRVLVTGGRGFVGRKFVAALQAAMADDSLLLLGVSTPSIEPIYPEASLDLLNNENVDRLIDNFAPDLVIHLAAQASSAGSSTTAGETWGVNLGGSLALAQAVATYVPEASVFFVSSAEVYGLSFNDGPACELTPLRPQSAYARSKAAAEVMLADVLPSSSRLMIVRPSNHSGPGQDQRFVIPAFAAQIAKIERGLLPPRIQVGNLTPQRDFLDIRDVVNAYLAVLGRVPTLPSRTTLNVGSGRPVAVEQILSSLRALSAVDTQIETDPARTRPSEVPIAANDASQLTALTGWRPRYSLNETLAAVLQEQRDMLTSAG